jgi:hypothetical protein
MKANRYPAVLALVLGLWGWLAPSQVGTAEAQITCPTLPADADYVAANAQSGQVTLYWSSANPALVLRKTVPFVGEAPANGTTYTVGALIGAATVVDNDSLAKTSFTQTTTSPNPISNGTPYYYKVFANAAGPCYAPGTVNTTAGVVARPASGVGAPTWSYSLAGGAMLKGGTAGTGTLYTTSNASRIVGLYTLDGTQSWAPAATNAPIQAWLTWLPVGSGSWYNTSWTARKKIRIDNTKVGAGGVTNFPVLISLTDPDVKNKAQATGNDILFTSSDGTTKLSHDIERYTSTTGELIAWVKVPSLSSTASTDLYMYYGNAAATNQQNAADVWSNGYVGVWHLEESPADPAPQFKDSTLNANHGTAQGGMTSTDQVAAKIGGGLNFIATAYVNAGTSTVFSLPVYSWSLWINGNAAPGCLTSGDNQQPLLKDTQFQFNWSHWPPTTCPGDTTFVQAAAHSDAASFWNAAKITSVNPLLANTWYYVVGTYDGTNLRVYLNGGLEATTAAGAPLVSPTQPLSFGNFPGATAGFTGKLDEIHISSVARSAAWIQTSYNNQSSPATFYRVGVEERGGVGGTVIGVDQGTGAANTGQVYSMDPGLGSMKWQVALTGADQFSAGPAAQVRQWSNATFQATYTNDVLFAATLNTTGTPTTNNKVFALDATTGAVLFGWPFNPSATGGAMDGVVGMPYVDYARNRLYVASRAGSAGTQQSLWVINTLNGTLVTSFALGHLETSPTLSYNGNTIYVGNTTGSLYAVDANTLTLKWSAAKSVGTGIKGFVWEDYVTAGRLYFGTWDGTAGTGNVWCVQDPGPGVNPNTASTQCAGWTADNVAVPGPSAALELGKLFVGSWNGTTGHLYQINLSTGAIEGGPAPAPKQGSVGDGTKQPGDVSSETGNEIFVGTTEGVIYKFPLTAGSL